MRRVFVLASVVAMLGAPLTSPALAASQTAPAPESPLASLEGVVRLTQSSVNGQVALGRGNVALNANLTDAGPDGEFSLSAPGRFALSLSVSNGTASSVLCGVVGPQEVTLNATRGSGVQLEFHDATSDASACARPSTSSGPLTMAPFVAAFQAEQPPPGEATQDMALDGLRRLAILALIGGLMFLFVPGLTGPLQVAANSRPWSRLGIGVCAVVTLPVLGAAIFLFGLALGLWWLGLLVLMFFACLLAISIATSGLVLGAWLAHWIGRSRVPPAVAFLTGLILLTVLGLAPSVGSVVNVLALIYGAGALILLPRSREPLPAPALAGAAPAPDEKLLTTVAPVAAPVSTDHDAAA